MGREIVGCLQGRDRGQREIANRRRVTASRGTPMIAHSSVMFATVRSSEPPPDPEMYKPTSAVHEPVAIAKPRANRAAMARNPLSRTSRLFID
jgi:hypothetical protein